MRLYTIVAFRAAQFYRRLRNSIERTLPESRKRYCHAPRMTAAMTKDETPRRFGFVSVSFTRHVPPAFPVQSFAKCNRDAHVHSNEPNGSLVSQSFVAGPKVSHFFILFAMYIRDTQPNDLPSTREDTFERYSLLHLRADFTRQLDDPREPKLVPHRFSIGRHTGPVGPRSSDAHAQPCARARTRLVWSQVRWFYYKYLCIYMCIHILQINVIRV